MYNFPKRFVLSIILLLSLSQTASAKYSLAVREFDDKTPERNAPSEAVTDMMITELNKADVFELVEREKLKYIAQEARLIEAGLVDRETAFETGKIHAARYTMTGAITLYYYDEKAKNVMLEIRIFDNATSKEIYTSKQLGSDSENLSLAARDAVIKHVSAIRARNWE